FGRVGKIVAEELTKRNEKFIVIDNNLQEFKTYLENHNILAFEADATNDEALKLVGIERAKSIIVATSNSAITVFVVLSARELNKDIFIVARSDEDDTVKKLRMAGADRIINPYATGGEKLANVALNSHVLDIVDSTFNTGNQVLKIEKYQMNDFSKFSGKSIKELGIRQKTGATIIGIIRNNEAELSPTPEYIIKSNDQLIILGTIEQIIKFNDFIKE
ncbi:MAG: TrkA family potassium uptake protein, partial [Candidatus Kapabacteria bacterium]|nr:TrkA family potassium uptake protein [Candidatus Kapabacteria bacterium]